MMSIMLTHLLRKTQQRNKVHPTTNTRRLLVHERRNRNSDSLEMETTCSTAPFFSTTPPITPVTPLSGGPSSFSKLSRPSHFDLSTSPCPHTPLSVVSSYHSHTLNNHRHYHHHHHSGPRKVQRLPSITSL